MDGVWESDDEEGDVEEREVAEHPDDARMPQVVDEMDEGDVLGADEDGELDEDGEAVEVAVVKPVHRNVIDFWEGIEDEVPNLADIAKTIWKIPCGNAEVERAFSVYTNMLECLSCSSNMSDEMKAIRYFFRYNRDRVFALARMS